MKRASFVLPPFAGPDDLAECVQSVLSQDWANLEVLLFRDLRDARNPAERLARDPRVAAVDADCAESLPRLLNRAISRASGDALFFAADCVRFVPEFTARYLDRLFERPDLAWAYGRFQEAGDGQSLHSRDVRTDAYDYSEGAQIGPVRGIKRACLDAVGGYDEGLSHAFEYDLRLLDQLAKLATDNSVELRRYRPVELVREFKRSLTRELDFTIEARNADRIRRNMRTLKWLTVPKVYW